MSLNLAWNTVGEKYPALKDSLFHSSKIQDFSNEHFKHYKCPATGGCLNKSLHIPTMGWPATKSEIGI